MGVRWWDGDVPKLLVTFNKACSMGLGTVGVAGRPGGGVGNSICADLMDANGAASWRKRSICIQISLNISGVRVSSPARNCLMSTVGIPSSATGVSNNSAVGVSSSSNSVVGASSNSALGVSSTNSTVGVSSTNSTVGVSSTNSTVGVSSSNKTASLLTVDGIVGPCNNACSASSCSAIRIPYSSPRWWK